MSIRRFQPADHLILSQWWNAHGWTPVGLDMLPATGFIVDGICAGFLYRTDSAFGILDWVISNPSVDAAARAQALDELIAALVNEAKRFGQKAIFSSVGHPGLIGRYEKHGFVKSDTGMTNMIRSM